MHYQQLIISRKVFGIKIHSGFSKSTSADVASDSYCSASVLFKECVAVADRTLDELLVELLDGTLGELLDGTLDELLVLVELLDETLGGLLDGTLDELLDGTLIDVVFVGEGIDSRGFSDTDCIFILLVNAKSCILDNLTLSSSLLISEYICKDFLLDK